MNIFEGSRRIAWLAAGVATAGTLFFAATYAPDVSIDYSISHPQGPFQRMNEPCPGEAGKHYFTTSSSSGKRVSIELCLIPMPFGDAKRELIPYKVDEKNMVWGAEYYSSEVSTYERALEARFVIPEEDEPGIEQEISGHYWDNWKECARNLGIGLAIFAGFVWAVGWIVRGFLGIPHGMDRKPQSEA